jgi:hypothetical protein
VFIEKVCGNCVDKTGRAKKGGTVTGKVIKEKVLPCIFFFKRFYKLLVVGENNMLFMKDGQVLIEKQ